VKLVIQDPKKFLDELNEEAFADPICGYYFDKALAVLARYQCDVIIDAKPAGSVEVVS
jgi:hypothetical protein